MIIAARRTPLCRANGALKKLRAHELLAPVLRSLLADAGDGTAPESVTDVVIGNAVGGGGNVARLAALEAGLPVTVPGVTVDRQCGSGLDAIVLASRLVAAGGGGLYLAGGVESISTAPLRAHRNDDGSPDFYSRAQFAPLSFGDPGHGGGGRERRRPLRHQPGTPGRVRAPQPPTRPGTPPPPGRSTPKSCPSPPAPAQSAAADDGPRPSLGPALMARFPPVFASGGTVTAGNSCFDADGAAAVVVTSMERARQLGAADGLLVLGTDTAGVAPQLLGIGAAAAAERLLAAHGLTAADVGLVEFNEAFAAQTLACFDQLGIDPERANLDGGALALGHAYGASGAVLVTRLLAQAAQVRRSRASLPWR